MSNSIEAIFAQYQKKFPLYNREAIVNEMIKNGVFDKMLETGEIKQSDLENIKKGKSLFFFDNSVEKTAESFDF